ncbi:hypothetical protein ACOME3_005688 [Neoechinorhynchus agilis]
MTRSVEKQRFLKRLLRLFSRVWNRLICSEGGTMFSSMQRWLSTKMRTLFGLNSAPPQVEWTSETVQVEEVLNRCDNSNEPEKCDVLRAKSALQTQISLSDSSIGSGMLWDSVDSDYAGSLKDEVDGFQNGDIKTFDYQSPECEANQFPIDNIEFRVDLKESDGKDRIGLVDNEHSSEPERRLLPKQNDTMKPELPNTDISAEKTPEIGQNLLVIESKDEDGLNAISEASYIFQDQNEANREFIDFPIDLLKSDNNGGSNDEHLKGNQELNSISSREVVTSDKLEIVDSPSGQIVSVCRNALNPVSFDGSTTFINRSVDSHEVENGNQLRSPLIHHHVTPISSLPSHDLRVQLEKVRRKARAGQQKIQMKQISSNKIKRINDVVFNAKRTQSKDYKMNKIGGDKRLNGNK